MELTLLRIDSLAFPATDRALTEPNGLLAVGGDLSGERLIEAYRRGIFPWYEAGQPILWWSPCPRMVLYPSQVHCSNSMRKWLRKTQWQVVLDRNFAEVISRCSAPRAKASGTWITNEMKQSYLHLHKLGLAHSVEVYDQERLVGGLYGVALGGVFYGESMFSAAANASKMALILLARYLSERGFALIDCQVASEHLYSLGAKEISRAEFEAVLQASANLAAQERQQPIWQQAANKAISYDGHLLD